MSSPGALGVFHAGGCVVLARHPEPAACFALIERERVTLTALVPALALAWLESRQRQRYDLSSLRLLQIGGADLAAEVARRIPPAFGCRLQQVFGMAEGLVNYTRADDPDELTFVSQGRPISADDEIRVVDDDDRDVADGDIGHLLTRGPYTIRGYYRAQGHNANAFTADGYYRTGDRVRRLPSGHLQVVGRAKDQINRGGEKIAAAEVEGHLLAHPGVFDAALVAVPDRWLGEKACAWIVARETAEAAPSARELQRFLRERGIAAYKLPDRIEFLDRLPRTAVGKVDKHALRSLAGAATHTQGDRP
jgi:2,3-dihydroxybenzoate-AMP ligase